MPLRSRRLAAACAALMLNSGVSALPAMASEIAAAPAEGILRVRSNNSFDETVARLRGDVEAKGIRFFQAIDQHELGAGAGIAIGRSTLVLFGNPPLGVQFLQSNPYAGLDWPVRMLVVEEADGSVWVAWTNFEAIGNRYHLTDRDQQLHMASEVAASIATAAVE